MAERFELSLVLPVAAERIYRAWLSSEEHGAFIGGGANITSQTGARFLVWDGYIEGANEELEPYHRIVQSWRTTEFPADSPDSRLEILLESVEGGTRLTLVHSNLPDGQGAQYKEGWVEHYFEPMQRYFAGGRPPSPGGAG